MQPFSGSCSSLASAHPAAHRAGGQRRPQLSPAAHAVLTGLRWQVREAEGGAEAWAEAEAALPRR